MPGGVGGVEPHGSPLSRFCVFDNFLLPNFTDWTLPKSLDRATMLWHFVKFHSLIFGIENDGLRTRNVVFFDR